ncbi:MAG: PadR family transcriptional regulator [Corynebacterium sp.]|nr:PadR family transcriptional regulator [Corynebacterium sp.]
MSESQMRKGVLELMVLAILDRTPSYGGALLETLTGTGGTDISSGTLYPLLSRLRRSGVLETRWEESPVGPPRKIYHLTEHGQQRLTALRHDWATLVATVTDILEEDKP